MYKYLPWSKEQKDPEIWVEEIVEEKKIKHPTTYVETLVHVVKGNVASGVFAMGDAFKNAGLAVGTCFTIFIGIIILYNNHALVRASKFVKVRTEEKTNFSETVDWSFKLGPPLFIRGHKVARIFVKFFVITTQLGFCVAYVLLVSNTLQRILERFEIYIHEKLCAVIIFIPILATCLITYLKILVPLSLVANVCLFASLALTLYAATSSDLPPVNSRPMYANILDLPLFVGTTIFTYEAIGLLLPLRNEMKRPHHFEAVFGVLNIAALIQMLIIIVMGFVGFWRFGDEVKESLVLNVPQDNVVAIYLQILFGLGIALSICLQFYVPADIIWNDLKAKVWRFENQLIGYLLLRTVLLTLTFLVSAGIPNVNLFISLMGSAFCTALGLVFPALCDIAMRYASENPIRTKDHWFRMFLIGFTLVFAVVGFATGLYVSANSFIHAFSSKKKDK